MELSKLKEARQKKGLTQVQLAKLVGVSINAYVRWEQGVNKPNEENFEKLIEVLRRANQW